MSIRLFLARLTRKVAAVGTVAAALWSVGSASAADVYTPSPAAAVNVYPGSYTSAAGCTTCEPVSVAHGTARFGNGQLLHRSQTLRTVNLCPGACFGYYQTQWRKWDEVCPYPYQGSGPAPVITHPVTPVPIPPRPLDPKMPEPKKTGNGVPMKPNGSDLPPIPTPSKFGP